MCLCVCVSAGGLYCEEDPAVAAVAADRQESVVLRQLRTAPVTAWVALRDTAAFVGSSTVDTASVSTTTDRPWTAGPAGRAVTPTLTQLTHDGDNTYTRRQIRNYSGTTSHGR